MKNNINYKTKKLSKYFKDNRVCWDQFYKSEHAIINNLDFKKNSEILDIGCGCGGLGLVLKNKFGIEKYTGVEINDIAARTARKMNPNAQIHFGDILELSKSILDKSYFDFVFSLSCVDWNVEFDEMLNSAWNLVRNGNGTLVATFRLTTEKGCNNINKSYQFINFNNKLEGEIANYVVMNANELFTKLVDFNPSNICAYGYFGEPSKTAVTPYKKICFTAFSITKRESSDVSSIHYNINLPNEITKKLKI